jgi:hypothetical protein
MNASASALPASSIDRPQLDHKNGAITVVIFLGLLVTGILIAGYSLGGCPRIRLSNEQPLVEFGEI